MDGLTPGAAGRINRQAALGQGKKQALEKAERLPDTKRESFNRGVCPLSMHLIGKNPAVATLLPGLRCLVVAFQEPNHFSITVRASSADTSPITTMVVRMLTKPRTVCFCQPHGFNDLGQCRALGALHHRDYFALFVCPRFFRGLTRVGGPSWASGVPSLVRRSPAFLGAEPAKALTTELHAPKRKLGPNRQRMAAHAMRSVLRG